MSKMSGSGREEIFLAISLLLSLPGILSATSSFKVNYLSQTRTNPLNQSISAIRNGEEACVHGFKTEPDICECNPCWSGPTCQDYVDRFAPRFLAEEPFFILDYDRMKRGDDASSKFPRHFETSTTFYSNDRGEVPLFRIEASDDDLGLTCQLGEVGPSATCPCATPRYAVVGQIVNRFYADPETGDVFLRKEAKLEAGKQYFITLQVSALEVKDALQEVWKEEIRARLFVREPEEKTKAEVSKTLLDFLKFTDLEMEKEAEENFAISPEEAQNLYTDRFLPKRKNLHSNSIFRYKRQVPKWKPRELNGGVESKFPIQISFLSNLTHWQSFNTHKIRIGIQIQLAADALRPNFKVEISIQGHGKEKGQRIRIVTGNVRLGKLVSGKVSQPSFTYIQNNANSITWNFTNISLPSRIDKVEQIICDVTLTDSTRLFNFDESSISTVENVTVVAQISVPLDSTAFQSKKIETFLQFPISTSTRQDQVGSWGGNGQRKAWREERNFESFQTKEDEVERPWLEVVGPLGIPKGTSRSYIIRLPVVVDLTRELTLSLYQIGNLTQGPISVTKLQLIRAGKKFLKTPRGVYLECTNESGQGQKEPKGQPSYQGCTLHFKSLNFLKGESNVVLEFEGIISSLPESTVGSTFELHAEADVNEGSEKSLMMMKTRPSRPTSKAQQFIDKFMTHATTMKTVTIIGTIAESPDRDKGYKSFGHDPIDKTSQTKMSFSSFGLYGTDVTKT